MTGNDAIGVAEIEAAAGRIAGRVHRTRTERSASLSELTGHDVHLKLEHQQRTGSFKLRGATNAVLSLSDAERERGVVGASTGNHGRGLAYAARQNGVRCIVAMSGLVPQNKIDGIKVLGAEVRIIGRSQDDAQVEVDRLVSEQGMTMIPPFDHPDIIAGQGTLGLEIADDLPELTTALVQVSGGGLISGVAAALKARLPDIKVIGVSMERGAAMFESQQAGKPIMVPELATLADSLGGGIGLDNAYTFRMTRDLVDDIVLINEAEIAAAIRHVYWAEQQIIEGSGSVGIAALLSRKIKPDGPTVALLSGGNIDMKLHHRIISGEDVHLDLDVTGGVEMPDIKILTEAELRDLVPLDSDAVDCIEQGFTTLAGGNVVMPPIMTLMVPDHNGEVCVKSAYVPGIDSFAMKISPGFFDNPKMGLPSTSGLMVLFSSQTGVLEALLLDNGYLTDLRTAAAGAVAARHLAREISKHVCIIGAGVQARLQLKALTLVRDIESATIWARDGDKARATATDLNAELGLSVTATDDIEGAVTGADIVVTTTPSTSPLLLADWLQPGQTIIAMGSDQEHKVELDPDCLAKATLYVPDSQAQCAIKGELRSAIEAGTIRAETAFPELGDITAGNTPGRGSDTDIIIADLTGTGVQDTAIATLARQRAAAAGKGTTFTS